MLSFRNIWSEEVIINNIYLSVDLESGKEIRYSIDVNFYEKKNRLHEGSISIAVNLFEFQNELKKIIVKAMIDRFWECI